MYIFSFFFILFLPPLISLCLTIYLFIHFIILPYFIINVTIFIINAIILIISATIDILKPVFSFNYHTSMLSFIIEEEKSFYWGVSSPLDQSFNNFSSKVIIEFSKFIKAVIKVIIKVVLARLSTFLTFFFFFFFTTSSPPYNYIILCIV